MEIYYVLDASAFINGFKLVSKNNFTVPEITAEIKDFKSKLYFDSVLENGTLVIKDVSSEYINCVNDIISESGDILRLSIVDKKLISLAYMFNEQGKDVKVISDDYTIQNSLRIITGKKSARDVKRNMVRIILLRIAKYVGPNSLKNVLRWINEDRCCCPWPKYN